MKVFLMYRDRDFDVEAQLPWNEPDLTQDLELGTVLETMASGDKFILEVARRAILLSLGDPDSIVYRQHVLADCLEHSQLIRQMYDDALDALKSAREIHFYLSSSAPPDLILSVSARTIEAYVDFLKKLRAIAEEHVGEFHSEGFSRFFAALGEELNDEYLRTLSDCLRDVQFSNGALLSAKLGQGNKGVDYVVRKSPEQSWRERLFGERSAYSFSLHPRDESGFKALSDIQAKGLNNVANAVAQSRDHLQIFFTMLRGELAFYIGCLNLHARLNEKGEAVCFPEPQPLNVPALTVEGLYDVALSLHLQQPVVGNDVSGDGKALIMITGANQGGKSTFLRSVGLAQLMMQSGMFVPAQSFRANVTAGIFTHYKREEDVTMTSGKLDEELSRMSEIADHIGSGCMLLCNESFGATNEREGSEIARQVARAMIEAHVKVIYVTHLYDLASRLYGENLANALFLRPEIGLDGQRTYRLHEAEPLPTSHGNDSFQRVFGVSLEREPLSASG